jgi:hypothetical protein
VDPYALTCLALDFVEPLDSAVRDHDAEARLLAALGFDLPEDVSILSGFGNAIQSLSDAAVTLGTLPDDAEDDAWTTAVSAALQALQGLVESINRLADDLDGATRSSPFVAESNVLAVLAERLLAFLIADLLRRQLPLVRQALLMFGVLEEALVDPAGQPHAVPFPQVLFHWDRLSDLFADPFRGLKTRYSWESSSGIAADTIIRDMWALGAALGLRAELQTTDRRAKASFNVALAGDGSVDDRPDARVARLPLLPGPGSPIGLELHGILDATGRLDGLAVGLYADPSLSVSVPLTSALTAEISLSGFLEGFGLVWQRGRDPRLVSAVFGEDPGALLDATAIDVKAAFVYQLPGEEPSILLGSPGATRLEVGTITIEAGLDKPAQGAADFHLGLALAKGKVVVKGGDGDGFLASVLGEGFEAPFDVGFGFSTTRGFYVADGTGLSIALHVGLSLGPVFVDTIELGVAADSRGARVSVGVTAGLEVGPIAGLVKGIGIVARLDTGKKGLLGDADLVFGFKPPTGVGLSLDTSSVKLAGVVIFDPDHHRYFGGIELSVLGKFDLTAIGLIETQMPDGSEGFSLLFIISFEFPAPILIAFGFYLSGVGGLLGLNRATDVDRLRTGLQAGAVDSILFPKDIVRRLDTIVTDLTQIFPAQRDQFLIGPMAKIQWMNPALITGKVGLIIEFDKPFRLAILGVIRAALPTEDEAILDIKVAFLGTIDFEKGLLAFDAVIYDSYIGYNDFKFTLEGSIALRVSWGAQKDFVISVGGFHPQFSPPTYLSLPKMKRLTLSLLKDNPRLSLSTYFAVTTNTIQFGARLDFYLGKSGFEIVGVFSFDVLLQFSPFRFLADAQVIFAVKADGAEILSINVALSLSGPTPWIAKGEGSFKILFFKVSFQFEKRFGEDRVQTLPEIAVLPKLHDELARDANWQGLLGADTAQVVRLAPRKRKDGEILVDAAGHVSARQGVLPLDTEFTLFANARPSDARKVRVAGVTLGGVKTETTPTLDAFAPAAFRDMSDADKLHSASYEQKPSGFATAGVGGLSAGAFLERPVRYELAVSGAEGAPRAVRDLQKADGGARTKVKPDRARFERLVPGGQIGLCAQSRARAARAERGTVKDASAREERFAVLATASLQALNAEGTPVAMPTPGCDRAGWEARVLLSRTDAEARRAALIRKGQRADDLEVAPEFQIAA